jgi:glutathione S-transferase
MDLVAFVIVAALIEFFVFGLLVGRARGQYKVAAPATTGHPIFERYFRVHQNTMEQLVMFIPSMWFFGLYVSPRLAALLGVVFIVGRVVYLRGYVEEPSKRETGTIIGAVALVILLLGAAIGALIEWI